MLVVCALRKFVVPENTSLLGAVAKVLQEACKMNNVRLGGRGSRLISQSRPKKHICKVCALQAVLHHSNAFLLPTLSYLSTSIVLQFSVFLHSNK